MKILYEINTRDSGGVSVENLSGRFSSCHFGHPFPNETGFNLWEHFALRNTLPQKWSNDTYNALFLFTQRNLTIYNRTTGKSLIYNDAGPTYYNRIVQVKFAKRIQELYTEKRYYNVDDIDPVNSGIQTLIPGSPTANVIESIKLKMNKIVFPDDIGNVHNVIIQITTPSEFVFAQNINDGKYKYIELDWKKTTTAGVNAIIQPMQRTGAGNLHLIGENIRVETELNDSHDDTILSPGLNQLEIIANDGTNDYAFAFIEIDYDPYGCYVSLLWQHSELGYVSYPFEGGKIESEDISKISELKKFLITLVDANELKEVTGYNTETIITLSTNTDKKYWPLLKELYSSRYVYLYVGDTGDEDSEQTWIQVEVRGSYTTNENINKSSAIFTIELKLIDKFNIKF